MKVVLLSCLLLLSVAGFCQGVEDTTLIRDRIRTICEYVSKNILRSTDKPNLWPLYIDINYSLSPFLYDTIKKTIPDLPQYIPRPGGGARQIPFKDSTVAHIFDDYKKAGGGMTLFLAPPQGRFFVGELKPFPGAFAGGYVLVFEFDGAAISRSYVGEWDN